MDDTINSLIYMSYKFNRINAPEISVSDWSKIFKNAGEMEILFQLEGEDGNSISR